MNIPIDKSKQSRKGIKGDMKIRDIKSHRAKSRITRKEFHSILDKASQPIKREAESDSEQP